MRADLTASCYLSWADADSVDCLDAAESAAVGMSVEIYGHLLQRFDG